MRHLLIAAALCSASVSVSAQDTTSASGAQAVAIVGGGSSGRSQRVHTTPDAIAPGIFPTHPCVVAYSGGVAVTGFGAAIGGGIVDPVCQAVNAAAIFAQIGRPDLADQAAEIGMDALRDSVREPSQPTPRGAGFQQGDFPS